jgi:hypothetical protein
MPTGDWRSQVLEVNETPSQRVIAAYTRLAPFYEVWARLTKARPRRRVLELAGPREGEAVLEVAIGTGAQLVELARRSPLGKGGRGGARRGDARPGPQAAGGRPDSQNGSSWSAPMPSSFP